MTPSVSDSSFVIPPRVDVIQPPPEAPKLRADGGSLCRAINSMAKWRAQESL